MTTIDDVLTSNGEGKVVPAGKDAAVLRLVGDVRPDDCSDSFRLYPNPRNRASFYLIPRQAVRGELHAWSAEELAAAGLAGERCFTVPLFHEAPVQVITIQNMRAENLRMVRKRSAAAGDCKGDIGGCPKSNPCTEVINGEEYCTSCCIA